MGILTLAREDKPIRNHRRCDHYTLSYSQTGRGGEAVLIGVEILKRYNIFSCDIDMSAKPMDEVD